MATLTTTWHQRAKEDLEQMKIALMGQDGQGGELKNLHDGIITEMQGDEMNAYFPNIDLHRYVLYGYTILQLLVLVTAILLMMLVPPVLSINIGMLLLLVQISHLIASLRSVSVDDLAGITFFGRPTSEPKPGLTLVPLFLMQLHVASRNYKDHRFPGPANKILRLSADEQSQRDYGDIPNPEQATAGFVRPIIVISRAPDLSAKERKDRTNKLDVDPFDERNTFEVAYVVRYRPNQNWGGIFRLIRNIGLPKNGTSLNDTIVDHLRENSERDLKALVARHTMATIIDNQELFNEVFALQLKASVMRLGIQIDPEGTGLDDINASHKTNEAQAQARRARFERQQTIIAADGRKAEIIREGEGIAEAERLLLNARAAGYKQIKDDTGVDGTVVIASETARNFKDANTIFGAQGIKEVLAMSDVFNNKKKEGDGNE